MICRDCGAEIDDRALICFRCGTATADRDREPQQEAPPRAARPRAAMGLVALFVLVVVYFLTPLSGGDPPHPFVWLVLTVAGVLLAWRIRMTK
ncbi:MAG: zinc-ribbon domain-containing protein [Acidobacteria bacterium]|nr:zinc-ribbon domain-containing protein [Acidobacteriota bacterium]